MKGNLAFVSYRVEYLVMSDTLECSGTSPLFDEVTIGALVPNYLVLVERHGVTIE